MRLFIGIDFPAKIKERIYQQVLLLKKKYPEIKWEKKENLHLTLKFLGNIKIKLKSKKEKLKTTTKNLKLEGVIKGIEKSVAGIESFAVKIGGAGYFLGNSLIVWLGIEEKTGRLLEVVKNLEREMGKLGFRREKRVFHPHVTLGRKRGAVPRERWRKRGEEITKLGNYEIGGFKVQKITLFESKLSREGANYQVIQEAKFKESFPGVLNIE